MMLLEAFIILMILKTGSKFADEVRIVGKSPDIKMYNIGNATIEFGNKIRIKFLYRNNANREIDKNGLLSGNLGEFGGSKTVKGRSPENNPLKLTFRDGTCLSISYKKSGTTDVYDVEWSTQNPSVKEFKDSYDLDHHWYGAAQVFSQEWPIEKWKRGLAAYVPSDSYQDKWGGVQERYWLKSTGASLFVDENVPLFVSQNNKKDGKLVFVAKYASPYKKSENMSLTLKYTVCIDSDIKEVRKYAVDNIFKRPTDIPDKRMFTHPIWSTWALFKKDINQSKVVDFAKAIKRNGFKACQLEIDDKWETGYGLMKFDSSKFPRISELKTELHRIDSDVRITLWVHPFSAQIIRHWNSQEYLQSSYFCGAGLGYWWNGPAYILDVTNKEAVYEFTKRLKRLQDDCNIDSFKFDGGELGWFPFLGHTFNESLQNPAFYTTKYAQLAYEADKNLRIQEVRVGFRTQDLPIFVRMMDKDSVWGWNNGLKTLIPHALTFGMIGYHFVLPDMIGGNGYKGKPQKELFIRWLQVTVFMPSLQFSYVPWLYDEETIQISKEMVDLHEKYADRIIKLAEESVQTGYPINRPLWWIAPNDEKAQIVDDEFLLGDDILVAPVVEEGARMRKIYFPEGKWIDLCRPGGETIQGPKTITYMAALEELPYFRKVESVEESRTDNAQIAVESVEMEITDNTQEDAEKSVEPDKVRTTYNALEEEGKTIESIEVEAAVHAQNSKTEESIEEKRTDIAQEETERLLESDKVKVTDDAPQGEGNTVEYAEDNAQEVSEKQSLIK